VVIALLRGEILKNIDAICVLADILGEISKNKEGCQLCIDSGAALVLTNVAREAAISYCADPVARTLWTLALSEAGKQACVDAQIWNMISSLPEGLDTVVGDRGYRLSGGEKQRIALARLLLKSPRVVILDEATAHLDSESERAVHQALDNALSGRTSVVIAHRLSTIRGAHQILVVVDGQIVQRGPHDQLLAEGGVYSDLYETQFTR
jgi:ABC-type multidrug transport system fused ATPase/permease subunit